MKPGVDYTFTDNFTIDREFDYGKISVELEGSSGTEVPSEIHAWLVRE